MLLSFKLHYLCISLTRAFSPRLIHWFFKPVRNKHQYQTRLACKSTVSLPTTRTNGIFNTRFYGSKVWNSVVESLEPLTADLFKRKCEKAIYCSVPAQYLTIVTFNIQSCFYHIDKKCPFCPLLIAPNFLALICSCFTLSCSFAFMCIQSSCVTSTN